ncbi:MAG TPA: class I SAM-dependent methyltransferase [Mycobacteriales bacterium]
MRESSIERRRDFFDRLYVAAEAGREVLPWDRGGDPQQLLADWAAQHPPDGAGRRAVVVGCGFGGDAEFLARHGFATTGFDFSTTAIAAARRLFPASAVEYAVADLLDLPPAWAGGFDFVLESLTVQSLPRSVRPRVTAAVRSLVAPGGTLLVISGQQGHRDEPDTGPWPLSRADVESFGGDGVTTVRVEEPVGPDGRPRWRAEFRRHRG